MIAAKLMNSTVPSLSKHRSLPLNGENPPDVAVTGDIDSTESSDVLDPSEYTVSSEDSVMMGRSVNKVPPGSSVVGVAHGAGGSSRLIAFERLIPTQSPDVDSIFELGAHAVP